MNYGTESKAASASYGIWNYILKLMPKPEQNEATTMIGRTLLATNESLWQEKIALQEILYELHGRASSNTYGSNGSPRRPTTASNKGNSKRMFQDALVYAKVHYEQDEHHLVFTDHVEELQMLQERHSFQLEDIMQLRELMQAIIQEECRKLEDMILHLQNLVEGVDTTKATSEEADFVALTKSFATTNMLHHAVPRQPAVASSSGVSSPKKSKHPLLPRNDIPTSKSIPKKLDLKFEDSVIVSNDSMDGMSKYLSEGVEGDGDRRPSRNNNNHASPSSPKAAHPRKGSTSRFRERLQDAQSELFLVDEF